MTSTLKNILFSGIFTLYSLSSFAQYQLEDIQIDKVYSVFGTPGLVTIKKNDSNVIIKGQVKKSNSSPGRRITGYVSIDYLTKSGKVLDSDLTKVYRRSPSKHTHTVFFKQVRQNLPNDTSRIRVTYDRNLGIKSKS